MSTAIPAQERRDRRLAPRFPMVLPTFIEQGGEKYKACLINLAYGGALIETFVPLRLLNSTVALYCGTIVVRALMVWTKDHQIGLKFEAPLTDVQIGEQLFRTRAIASRRESRLQSARLA